MCGSQVCGAISCMFPVRLSTSQIRWSHTGPLPAPFPEPLFFALNSRELFFVSPVYTLPSYGVERLPSLRNFTPLQRGRFFLPLLTTT